MKERLIGLIITLMMGISFCGCLALFAEETAAQRIAALEKKLPGVSGKEKIKVLSELAFLYKERMPGKTLDYGRQQLELSRKLKDEGGEARALYNIAIGYNMSGNHEKALDYVQRALKIFEKLGDKGNIAGSFDMVGLIYQNLKNYDKALEYHLKSVKIREEIGDEKWIAHSLSNIARFYDRLNNFNKALEYHLKAVEIMEEIGDKKVIAKSLNEIGVIYYKLNNPDQTLEYFLKSLKLRKEIGDKKGIGDSLSDIGNIYMLIGNYDRALACHLQSLTEREELGEKRDISVSLTNIGSTYACLNNHDKSLEYQLEALKIMRAIGDQRGMASSMNNIGTAYGNLGNYDKALDYFLESLKIKEKIGNRREIANSLNNIGTIYSKKGKYHQALEFYNKALEIRKEIGDKWRIAASSVYIGEVYLELKNYNESYLSFSRGLKISKAIKAKDIIKDSYKGLSQLYAAKGNYKEALRCYMLYAEVKDTIFNESSSKQIAQMQTRYETLKKEKEIDILKKNNEIQKLRLSRERMTRNAFIFGFILVLAFTFLLFRKFLYLFSFWKKQKYISQYRLQEVIGSGGMGTVYKAHSIRDKTDTVAIKILKEELFNDETSRKRFKQEAAIIDKLEHPNIVKIIERGEYKNRLFIAMEFFQGKTLSEKIDEHGQMDLKECLDIMMQATDALVLMHGKEIIHRDLKPSNIMLIEKDGNVNFVKLLDFGLARMKYQTRITRTGVLVGTFNYMAPEQLAHSQFSTASDVYSLGVTFYEIVTAKVAFPGETANDIMKQVLDKTPVEPVRFRPDIPGELNDLIMKMLEKNKESRPVIREVLENLQKIKSKFNCK